MVRPVIAMVRPVIRAPLAIPPPIVLQRDHPVVMKNGSSAAAAAGVAAGVQDERKICTYIKYVGALPASGARPRGGLVSGVLVALIVAVVPRPRIPKNLVKPLHVAFYFQEIKGQFLRNFK